MRPRERCGRLRRRADWGAAAACDEAFLGVVMVAFALAAFAVFDRAFAARAAAFL